MVALVGTGVFMPLPVLTLLLSFRKIFPCTSDPVLIPLAQSALHHPLRRGVGAGEPLLRRRATANSMPAKNPAITASGRLPCGGAGIGADQRDHADGVQNVHGDGTQADRLGLRMPRRSWLRMTSAWRPECESRGTPMRLPARRKTGKSAGRQGYLA